jgi:uncharacterized membrane protein YheB (UPF0754 family)
METFLLILRYAAGPIIGAVIGYFTNWLAVKMLFRPRNPIKIGKHTLPFTPGIIPKRKPALAKAVGKAVGEQLFTKDDLTNAVLSDEAKAKIQDSAVAVWRDAGDKSAAELASGLIPAEKCTALKENAQQLATDKIFSAVQKADLGAIVATEGTKVVAQKKASLGMLSMLITDDLVSSLMGKLADGVNTYVQNNGREMIEQIVTNEVGAALHRPLKPITQAIDETTVRKLAGELYEKGIKSGVALLTEKVDIAAIVEKKINDMDVKELEKLVLSVMKKELNSIVNLGAIIGFLLGVVMIFL